jgi:thiol-disulfide isomerase/thioredoxin
VNLQGGKDIKLGPASGKVQALVFYASWCGYCRKALPLVEQIYQKYASNEGVDIVAINLDDRAGNRARTEEQTLEHYKSLNLHMPLVLDSEHKVGKDYRVGSYPTMVVLGKTGNVEAVHVGAPAGFDKVLDTEIETLLAGKPLMKEVPVTIPVDGGQTPVKAGTVAAPAAAGDSKPSDGTN